MPSPNGQITINDGGKTYRVNWGGAAPPTSSDVQEILHAIRSQTVDISSVRSDTANYLNGNLSGPIGSGGPPGKPLQIMGGGQVPGTQNLTSGLAPQAMQPKPSDSPNYDPSMDFATNYGQLPLRNFGRPDLMQRAAQTDTPLRRAMNAMMLPGMALGGAAAEGVGTLAKSALQDSGDTGSLSHLLASVAGGVTSGAVNAPAQMMDTTLEHGPGEAVSQVYHSMNPMEAKSGEDLGLRVANLLLLGHGALEAGPHLAAAGGEALDGLRDAGSSIYSKLTDAANTPVAAGGMNESGAMSLPQGLVNAAPDTTGIMGRIGDALHSNLHELEGLDPEAALRARYTAAAPESARKAYQAFEDSVGGPDVAAEHLRYQTQSNLQGAKDFNTELAGKVEAMSPDEFLAHWNKGDLKGYLDNIRGEDGQRMSVPVQALVDSVHPTQEAVADLLRNVDQARAARDAASAAENQASLAHGASTVDHASSLGDLQTAQESHAQALAELEQRANDLAKAGDQLGQSQGPWKNLAGNDGYLQDDAFHTASNLHASQADFVRQAAQDLEDATRREQAAATSKEDTGGALTEAIRTRQAAETALKIAERKAAAGPNADPLQMAQGMISESLRGTAAIPNDVMTPEEFAAYHADPGTAPKTAAWERLVGQYLEESHYNHGGIITNKTGPAGVYTPLIREPETAGPQTPGSPMADWGTPNNRNNNARTGSADVYSLDKTLLLQRLSSSIRASERAQLMQHMADSGLLQPTDEMAGTKGLTITVNGKTLPAAVVQTDVPLRAVRNGKLITVEPGANAIMPAQVKTELDPILHPDEQKEGIIQKAIEGLNKVSTMGIGEAVAHGENTAMLGLSHVPPRSNSALDLLQHAVLPARFAGLIKDIVGVDWTDPKTQSDFLEMVRSGGTRSTKRAMEAAPDNKLPIQQALGKMNLKEAVFGPHGLENRVRLAFYQRAKGLGASALEAAHAVDSLGTYTRGLDSQFERAMKTSGFSPFATAGKTKLIGSVDALTGRTPAFGTPGAKLAQRAATWIGNATGPVMAWYLGQKAANGKFPNEDPDSKFMQIHLPSGNYINLARMFSMGAGLQNLGVSAFADAKKSGASNGLAARYGEQGLLNHALSPVTTSPLLGLLTRSGLGANPYITTMDRTGSNRPGLMPGAPDWGNMQPAANLAAGVAGTNPMLKLAAAKWGGIAPDWELKRDEHKTLADRGIQTLLGALAPGTISETSTPTKHAALIHEQDRPRR